MPEIGPGATGVPSSAYSGRREDLRASLEGVPLPFSTSSVILACFTANVV